MATPTTLPATFVAGNVLTAVQMNDLRGAFRIMQVVSTTKTDTFTTSSTSFTDVTGLSATITPSATSSKILAMVQVTGCAPFGTVQMFVNLVRGSTAISIGDAAGSRQRITTSCTTSSADWGNCVPIVFLDSPATTSATTYKIQICGNTANTIAINRTNTDSDATTYWRGTSSITLFEVSA